MPSDQVKYTSKLVGYKVLIVGGTSGIGFAVAEALLEQGAVSRHQIISEKHPHPVSHAANPSNHAQTVTLSSSSAPRVQTAISRLQAAYPSKASYINGQACDLSTDSTLESNIRALLDFATNGNTHKLDHVVSTAGDPFEAMPLSELDIGKAKQAGMVRFFAPLMLGKLAPLYLNPGPASSITLTSGSVSQKPLPNWSVMNGFATGLHGITRGMALDLKPLRVNLICPGAVETEFWENQGMPEAQKKVMLEAFSKGMATGIVPGPEEIAESYVFVLRDRNMTGTVVSTNGGALLMGH